MKVFSLSFVYGMSKIGIATYGNITATVARQDIVAFFGQCIVDTKDLFQKAIDIMLSKGIYDHPPKIPYPNNVSYVTDQSYMAHLLGSKRPLNVMELTELFFHIERNYFGTMVTSAFLQVVKDEQIKKYMAEGKKLTEKQIQLCNDILHKDGMQGNIPVSMEITDSTQAPFSDKLMLFLLNSLNSTGIHYIGHAISVSTRKDLASKFVRLLPDVLTYGEDGLNLLIARGWFEQPPQGLDRKELINEEK
ncbi:DUF3231 family protein [Radiobacillus sp. PE A8.2]|uniref:DUF3231 family protein n=1 Tax=Radiobacillus sp. PE A8.2 TaxID=3380349 RepID=UPI00388DE555